MISYVIPAQAGIYRKSGPNRHSGRRAGICFNAGPGISSDIRPDRFRVEPGMTNMVEPGMKNMAKPGMTNMVEPGMTDMARPGMTDIVKP